MLVPKLRFKREDGTEYPEWESYTIKNVATIKNGPFGSVLHSSDYVESGFPIITTEHFKSGFIQNDITSIPKVSEDDYKRLKGYVLQTNDIVFSRVGTVDINALVSYRENGWLFSGRVIRVRPNSGYNSAYLHYLLSTQKVKNDIISRAVGQTMPSINSEILNSTTLNITPEIEEQQKIAYFLSTVDEVITQSEAEVQNLEQQKKAAMQKIFSQEVRFKREDGSEYPEWEEKAVAEVFKITRGYVLSAKLVKPIADNEYRYPVFSSQTKDNGLMGYYKEYLYENAITWTTDGANAGTVRFRKGKFYCTNVCGVLLNETGFANQCIAEYLNSVAFKYVSYVGNPKLMNNIMAEIPIVFPCLEEQQKIADFLSAYDEAISYAKQEFDKWKELKKGLLQQMFV